MLRRSFGEAKQSRERARPRPACERAGLSPKHGRACEILDNDVDFGCWILHFFALGVVQEWWCLRWISMFASHCLHVKLCSQSKRIVHHRHSLSSTVSQFSVLQFSVFRFLLWQFWQFGSLRSSDAQPKRPNDRTTERPNDRMTKRPNDRTTERQKRQNDKATKRQNDKTTK